ncbi:MAG: hypothetical protein U5L45_16180 [Saprospiraceae bacterium]|nr:hypothetical protein [Saprospiraceae bacterium]
MIAYKLSNCSVTRSLRSREEGEAVCFSGKARKTNRLSFLARAKRAMS